jgi:hypothetical protein
VALIMKYLRFIRKPPSVIIQWSQTAHPIEWCP